MSASKLTSFNIKDDSTVTIDIELIKEFIKLDYYNDVSGLLFAGSAVLVIYLNILVTLFSLLTVFDSTRNWYLGLIGGYLGVMLIMYVINMLVTSLNCICKDLPELVNILNYTVLVSCITFAFRFQQMFNRCIILVLIAPIYNLTLAKHTSGNISYHYKSLLLSIDQTSPEV
jgi:hypothetical protein